MFDGQAGVSRGREADEISVSFFSLRCTLYFFINFKKLKELATKWSTNLFKAEKIVSIEIAFTIDEFA